MRLPSLAAAAVACFLAFPSLADWSPADMNRQIDQTNFVVNEGCSGTLIDAPNRYILTAAHCVTAQYEVIEREVIDDDGKVTTEKVRRLKPGAVRQIAFANALAVSEVTYRTKVVSLDKNRDLALIQVVAPIPNKIAAKLGCGVVRRGDAIYVVGNPKGILYSNVVKGIVSSMDRSYEAIKFGEEDSQQKPLMQVSAGVIGGNSGGAVYDADGRLIGVPVIAHTTNEILGFAVPLTSIKEFLMEAKLDGVYSYCRAPR